MSKMDFNGHCVGEAVCADLPAMFDKARVARGRMQVVLSRPCAPQPPALPPLKQGLCRRGKADSFSCLYSQPKDLPPELVQTQAYIKNKVFSS